MSVSGPIVRGYNAIVTPRLKDWMPKPGRTQPWTSLRGAARQRRRFEEYGLPGRILESLDVVRAWTKIADKVRMKTGVDLVESESPFVWDDLHSYAERISTSLELHTPTSAFVLLKEGWLDSAFLIEVDSLRLDSLREWFDVCLAPWPRVGWLAMRPHEPDIGPYRLDL